MQFYMVCSLTVLPVMRGMRVVEGTPNSTFNNFVDFSGLSLFRKALLKRRIDMFELTVVSQ